MNKTWGIIGLGWLGSKLAEHLDNLKVPHWGTHQSTFSFINDPFPKNPCSILFLNTPPLLEIDPVQYTNQIPIAQFEKIIFISSTSVYGSQSGVLDEDTVPKPVTLNAKWLLQVEKLLFQQAGSKVIVIRPGGLIGGQRHPVYFMSRQQAIADQNAPINLIHRYDLIQIILSASTKNDTSIINAVAPYHPRKIDYYNGWAIKLGLPPLKFINEQVDLSNRIIQSKVIDSIHAVWVCPGLDFL